MSTAALNPFAPAPRAQAPFGEHLRWWRQQRRLSQLDLADEAAISTRHLSFMETGRSTPSREMVLRLAERLDVPLRERNRMLTAAGYAPMFGERRLDDPALGPARQAMEQILRAHEPFPALLVDRHWTLVSANRMVPLLLQGLPAELLQPPLNVLRVSLHPHGLAPRIANFAQWREHLLARLRQQVEASGDATLAALADELKAYPMPAGETEVEPSTSADSLVATPLQLRTPLGTLSLIGTITVFGTPADVTLSELALETFFPADAASGELLRQLAQALDAAERPTTA